MGNVLTEDLSKFVSEAENSIGAGWDPGSDSHKENTQVSPEMVRSESGAESVVSNPSARRGRHGKGQQKESNSSRNLKIIYLTAEVKGLLMTIQGQRLASGQRVTASEIIGEALRSLEKK